MQTILSEDIIKILPKGLMTIPIKFRKALGLVDNGIARIKEDKGRLIIEHIYTIPYPVRTYKNEEIDQFLAQDKKDSIELKKKKLLP